VGSAYALDLHSEGGVEGRTVEPKKPMPPPPAPNGYAANFIPPRRRSQLPRQTTCTWFGTIGIAEGQAGDRSRAKRKANGQRTSKRPNRPSPWPMLRNATVSEEDNHARFCSPAFRNRFP
jgi:hypothetical protein